MFLNLFLDNKKVTRVSDLESVMKGYLIYSIFSVAKKEHLFYNE